MVLVTWLDDTFQVVRRLPDRQVLHESLRLHTTNPAYQEEECGRAGPPVFLIWIIMTRRSCPYCDKKFGYTVHDLELGIRAPEGAPISPKVMRATGNINSATEAGNAHNVQESCLAYLPCEQLVLRLYLARRL